MFIYVQLIFEQHGFELRRSTYTIIFFNKYIPQHRTISSWLNCWMWSLRYGGPTVSYTRIFDTQKVGTLTFRLFKGQLYTHTHCCCCSVVKSYPPLWPCGLQHTRLPWLFRCSHAYFTRVSAPQTSCFLLYLSLHSCVWHSAWPILCIKNVMNE